ncbi:MAG: RING finger protein [Planctomycetota bacterium]
MSRRSDEAWVGRAEPEDVREEPAANLRARGGAEVRCPFCHDGVSASAEAEACPGCAALVHRACWDEAGRCPACSAPSPVTPRPRPVWRGGVFWRVTAVGWGILAWATWLSWFTPTGEDLETLSGPAVGALAVAILVVAASLQRARWREGADPDRPA